MVQNSVFTKNSQIYALLKCIPYGIELCANKGLLKKRKLLQEVQIGTTEPSLLEYVLFGMYKVFHHFRGY